MTIKLPTPDDGVEGLLGLASQFSVSTAVLYRFLGYLRDNVNGSKVIAEVRQIIALRMVTTLERRDPGCEARQLVADSLGYPANQKPYFYVMLRQGQKFDDGRADPDWTDRPLSTGSLPTADDGVDGLLGMLPTYDLDPGDLFQFLGWPLSGAGAQLVGRAREILAARLVLAFTGGPVGDYGDAQRDVAKDLGYPLRQRPNFYKRVARGLELLEQRGEI